MNSLKRIALLSCLISMPAIFADYSSDMKNARSNAREEIKGLRTNHQEISQKHKDNAKNAHERITSNRSQAIINARQIHDHSQRNRIITNIKENAKKQHESVDANLKNQLSNATQTRDNQIEAARRRHHAEQNAIRNKYGKASKESDINKPSSQYKSGARKSKNNRKNRSSQNSSVANTTVVSNNNNQNQAAPRKTRIARKNRRNQDSQDNQSATPVRPTRNANQ